jgi:ankyrin repeat protein
MLVAGSDVAKKDQYGNTALIEAAREGNFEVVSVVLVVGVDVNTKGRRGATVLYLAEAA